jgi:hypothetical protein
MQQMCRMLRYGTTREDGTQWITYASLRCVAIKALIKLLNIDRFYLIKTWTVLLQGLCMPYSLSSSLES